ncbi:glycosyltransferase family 4 protein [Kosakonia sp. MUSA4]|uniref:glycosyltransferase family 4 protein n=1 Tax=Kosakonia sp. MUSA4 TaxID=2067958 RepID=UPI00159A6158|nr:glycosyltransferase family 4 protein [Kosakonia sp. MUSA4]QJT81539.1 glycosyl transferase family 1 [Kosakonia sp. MUSA4]
MANQIIILARSLPFHHLGGMEIVAWDLAVELKNKGYQVSVITTDFDTDIENEIDGPALIKLKNIPRGKYSSGWWKKTAETMLAWENKNEVCAVISISAGAFGVLKHKDKFPYARFIMQAHGTSMGELVSKLKTKKIKKALSAVKNIIGFISDAKHYRAFDWIVAVGDAVYDDLNAFPTRIICTPEKIIKIENGIDQNIFTDSQSERERLRNLFAIPQNALVFMSASRLHEQKGVDTNIRLFASIKNKIHNAKYVICGDGPYEAQLHKIVQDYGLAEDILFLGAKTRRELSLIMQCADIFLFLTKRIEGLPLNILEAMSAGLPLIISEHLSFEASEKIIKCNAACIDNDSMVDDILNMLSYGRESYIKDKNTLTYSVDKYISLIQSNNK